MAVYLWQDVQAWQPWDNTVAYRPLNSTTTVNDQSGNNYTLTQTWGSFVTLWGVDCFYNGWGVTWYFQITSADKIPSSNDARTISMRARPTDRNSSQSYYMLGYWEGTAWGNVRMYLSYLLVYAASFGTTMSFEIRTNKEDILNERHLHTITFDGVNLIYYIDWISEWKINWISLNTTGVSSSYPLYIWRYSVANVAQFRWYLSEVIIEDKARARTDVLNYFNLNKSKYWL